MREDGDGPHEGRRSRRRGQGKRRRKSCLVKRNHSWASWSIPVDSPRLASAGSCGRHAQQERTGTGHGRRLSQRAAGAVASRRRVPSRWSTWIGSRVCPSHKVNSGASERVLAEDGQRRGRVLVWFFINRFPHDIAPRWHQCFKISLRKTSQTPQTSQTTPPPLVFAPLTTPSGAVYAETFTTPLSLSHAAIVFVQRCVSVNLHAVL